MDVSKAQSLKAILQQLIGDNFNRRATEKTVLLNKANALLELKEVQNALFNDIDWPNIVRAIGSLTRTECDENIKKSSQNVKNFKTNCFGLWKLIVDSISRENILCDYVDLIDTALMIFSKRNAEYRFIDFKAWLDSLDILMKIFNFISFSDIPFGQLKQIWSTCTTCLKNAITEDKRVERQKLAKFYSILIKSSGFTQFRLQITEIIDECCRITSCYEGWLKKDISRTYLLAAINYLFAEYSFEHRDILLNGFFYIAELLINNISLFGVSEDSIVGSTDESERFGLTFENCSWNFLEWIVILSAPDNELNIHNYQPIFSIINTYLSYFVDDIETRNKRNQLSHKHIKLPALKLPLLARLLVLDYSYQLELEQKMNSLNTKHKDNLSNTKLCTLKTKRFKAKTAMLHELLFSDLFPYSNLQILYEILKDWGHRLENTFIDIIADYVIKVGKTKIKDDDRLILIIKILNLFVERKSNVLDFDCIWDWAISFMHNKALQSVSCLLLLKILTSAGKSFQLSLQMFSVLISKVSRFLTYCQSTLDLLHYLISNFDFNENFVFRVELNLQINNLIKEQKQSLIFSTLLPTKSTENSLNTANNNANYQITNTSQYIWSFRQQIIYSILIFCEPETDPTNLLFSLFCYTPSSIYKMFLNEQKFKQDFDDKKFQFWRVNLCLRAKLKKFCKSSTYDSMFDLIQPILDNFLINRLDSLISNGNFNEMLKLVHINELWCWDSSVSLEIKQFFEEKAASGHTLLYQIILNWSSNVPRHIWKETFLAYKPSLPVGSSSKLEEILLNTVDDLPFYDIITILNQFGHYLNDSTLLRFINALILEAEDPDNESIYSQTSPSSSLLQTNSSINLQKTKLYQLLTTNYIVKYIRFNGFSSSFLNMKEFPFIQKFFLSNASSRLLVLHFSVMPTFYFFYDVLAYLNTTSFNLFTMFNLICEKLVPKSVEHLYFLRRCLLENTLYDLHFTALKLLLNNFSYLTCCELVENFENLIEFHEPCLAFYLNSSNVGFLDSVDFEKKLKLKTKQNSFLKFLLNLSENFEVCHSPGIFFLSTDILKKVVLRSNFKSTWVSMFNDGNFIRLFQPLKQHLSRLISNKQINCSKIFLTILNSFLILFKNFQWLDEKNVVLFFTTLSDIFCIINCMFYQTTKIYKCAESELLLIISKWVELVVELAIEIYSFSSIINCFYALSLQTIDILSDYCLEFPHVWQILVNMELENLIKQKFFNENKNFEIGLFVLRYISKYCQSMTMLGSEISKMEEIMLEFKLEKLDFSAINTIIQQNTISLLNCIANLRGFWRFIMSKITNDFLTESSLEFFCSNYFLSPHLRGEMTLFIALFPSDFVNHVFNNFIRKLCIDGELEKFISEHSLRLLFSKYIFPPDVSIALYNIVIFSVIHDTKKSEALMIRSTLIEKPFLKTESTRKNNGSTDEDNMNLFFDDLNILPFALSDNNNTCINVFELFECAQKIGCSFPQKLTLFLPVIQFLPVYGSFLITRVLNQLAKNWSEAQRRVFIVELNKSFIQKMELKELKKNTFSKTALSASLALTSSLSITSTNDEINNSIISNEEFVFLIALCCICEFWHESVCYIEHLSFVKCLLKAKLFDKAFYFLKRFIDLPSCFSIDGNNIIKNLNIEARSLFHIRSHNKKTCDVDQNFVKSSIGDLIDCKALKFFTEIFIGMRDSISMSTLPLQSKISLKSRIFLAESNHDWGVLGGLYCSIQNFDKIADTFYYLGGETIDQQCSIETQYASVVKLASWNCMEQENLVSKTSIISFPKIIKSHSQKLYALFHLQFEGKSSKFSAEILNSLLFNLNNLNEFKLIKNSFGYLDNLRDLIVLNQNQNIFCLLSKPRELCLSTLSSWYLAKVMAPSFPNNLTKLETCKQIYLDMTNVVISRCKYLRKINAYQPALKLLKSLEDSILKKSSSEVFIDLLTTKKLMGFVYVERAKLLLANKEPLMASFFLRCVLNTKFNENRKNLNENVQNAVVTPGISLVYLENDFDSQIDLFGNNDTEINLEKDVEVLRLKIKSHNLLAKISFNSDSDQSFKHLKEACILAHEYDNQTAVDLRWKTFLQYALYAEKRYHELRIFTESHNFALKKEAIVQWQNEMQKMPRTSTEDRIKLQRRIKEIECEQNDISKITRTKDIFLKEATTSYLNTLALTALNCSFLKNGEAKYKKYTDTLSTTIYRFAALLMQNVNNNDMMNYIMERIDRIPTYIWLPIFNTLFSHLFSTELPISQIVEKIALIVLCDHPYHSVYYFLFYFYWPDKFADVELQIARKRRKIASDLLKKAMNKNTKLKIIINTLKRAHDIFREFSRTNISTFERILSSNGSQMNQFKIPVSQRIVVDYNILQSVPIPTLKQRVNKLATYSVSDFVTWNFTEPICIQADGLSAPKVAVVIGSDGKKYKIIFKKEDLRQDALVQQLFKVANILMIEQKYDNRSYSDKLNFYSKEKENFQSSDSAVLTTDRLSSLSITMTSSLEKSTTLTNNLRFSPLRTYNVIPLDMEFGLIEWCSGTQSLCTYLAGTDRKSGAHKRYNPQEISVSEARIIMEKKVMPSDSSETCIFFLNLCQKISPVLRYFFYEKFYQPEIFHQRITAYTHSLAQWSIVCYVVGLGDRHLSNILIDEKTGELVHIDLGMIFEFSQRVLKYAETVPFRLTRELVDPILVDGVNGHFKKIAVRTLQQMRDSAQVLIGISSLILHDPISTFALMKKSDANQRNLFAEMAILRLKEKLAGRDLCYAEMNAEQQVSHLIKDASDPDKLCRMYHGWMAFL